MAQNFLTYDRDQPLLLPPDLREWLAEDHLAWFVIEATAALDLSDFYAGYRSDGHGAAAHDPQMMVALLLYAYATGERSSRQIERRLREDVAYRVIAANAAPDHATIARFRVRHEDALAGLFTQVLGLCAEAGLATAAVVAIDGTKVEADASERQSRGYEQIAREVLGEAARIDAEEDAVHGDKRGDELPPELATHAGRQTWIREALRRQAEQRAADPQPVPRERAARAEICRDRLLADWRAERRAHREFKAEHERRASTRGSKPMGRPPKHAGPPAQPSGKANLTDPDSKKMKSPRGYLQGYNAQLVANEQQIVLAAEVITDGNDFGALHPMTEAAAGELERAGSREQPRIVLADAGYWRNDQIERLRETGAIPLVAPDADSRAGPRPSRRGGPYEFMRRALRSEEGRQLYSRRQAIVEPIFGDIKANRRAGRFKRRGLAAARSEWRLLTATHNLLKLHRHSISAAAG